MLPLTLSALGVREGAWVLLLAPLGDASTNVIGFSLTYPPEPPSRVARDYHPGLVFQTLMLPHQFCIK